MEHFLFLISTLFLSTSLLGQADYTYIEDLSGTGYSDRVAEMELDQDTIYSRILMTIDDPENPGATLSCNGLLVMDNQGNVIKKKQYPTIFSGTEFDQMLIETDRILITHGESVEEGAKQYITQIDRVTLEVDTVYTFDTGLDIKQSSGQAFGRYRDKYVIGLSSRYIGEFNTNEGWVGNYLVIDAQTMEADTLLYLPVDHETSYAYDIYEEGADLVIYYVAKKPWGHGFIRLDSTYQIQDQYIDSFEPAFGLNNWHQTEKRANGDFIYCHLDNGSRDVFSIDNLFNLNWETDLPIPQYLGLFGTNIVNTDDGDLLITGSLNIAFEYTPYDWMDLELNDYRFAPYVAKLDGETGEVLWHHFYIGVDDFGVMTYYGALDIVEVSSGDLYAGGLVVWQSQEPRQLDTGIFMLPQDGCLNPQTGCHLYQFIDQVLTSTDDEIASYNGIIIKQLGDQVLIEMTEVGLNDYIVLLSAPNGQVIHSSRLDGINYQYSLTTFPPGVYFLSVVSSHGEYLKTLKVER